MYIEKAVTMPVVLAEFITALSPCDTHQRIRMIKALFHMSYCLGLKEAKLVMDRLATGDYVVNDDMAIVILPKGS